MSVENGEPLGFDEWLAQNDERSLGAVGARAQMTGEPMWRMMRYDERRER